MRWQCCLFDADGNRCPNEAVVRLHFSNDHPFDHTDLCQIHFKEYSRYVWAQVGIQDYGAN